MKCSDLLNVLCALGLALLPAAASAADPVTVRVSDHFPVNHIVSAPIKVWMDRVTDLTGGKVKFSYFTSEQLVKQREALPALQRRIVDVALVNPGLFPTEFPLTGVSFLPGGYDDTVAGGAALQKLFEHAAMRGEFTKAGITPLLVVPIDAYEIMARVAVRTPEQVKGLRLRTVGDGQAAALRALGGTPVTLGVGEVYTAIQRSTIDGALFPYGVAQSYKMDEVTKFGTLGAKVAAAHIFYAVSNEFWNRLDPSYRDAIQKANSEMRPAFWRVYDEGRLATINAFRARGMAIEDVGKNAATRDAWAAVLKPLRAEWARQMDAKRLPGTEVLRAWDAALASTR